MTSNSRLVPAPASLITEVCGLLEYGLAKECAESRALHDALTKTRADFADSSTLPVPLPLLHQLQRALFLLGIRAGEEFAPGEKIVRFTRGADRIRTLLRSDEQRQAQSAP